MLISMYGAWSAELLIELAWRPHLQVGVFLVGQRHVCSSLHLLLVLLEHGLVDLDFWWCKSRCGDELERLVTNEFSSEPEERLLEVVVRLGRNVVVLEVLLAVEGDSLCLDLALLDIDLVSGQNNGDVFANADKIAMPVWNVFVGDTGGDIKHDDAALAVDIVAIAQTTKFLLAGRIPNVELNLTQVRSEAERVDFYTKGCDILLLELASNVTLYKGGLAGTTVTNKNELEGGDA